MADTTVTKNVFIDTQEFVAHHLDFESANLRTLARLGNSGTVKLLLTTVTVGEVRAHLSEQAKKTFQ